MIVIVIAILSNSKNMTMIILLLDFLVQIKTRSMDGRWPLAAAVVILLYYSSTITMISKVYV